MPRPVKPQQAPNQISPSSLPMPRGSYEQPPPPSSLFLCFSLSFLHGTAAKLPSPAFLRPALASPSSLGPRRLVVRPVDDVWTAAHRGTFGQFLAIPVAFSGEPGHFLHLHNVLVILVPLMTGETLFLESVLLFPLALIDNSSVVGHFPDLKMLPNDSSFCKIRCDI